jgi:hypothetical protein
MAEAVLIVALESRPAVLIILKAEFDFAIVF